MYTFLLLSLALMSIILAQKEPTLENQYIIVYKDEIDDHLFHKESTFAAKKYSVLRQYRHAIKGYAAKLSAAELEEVRKNPHVKYVEKDNLAEKDCVTPIHVESWGLTRIAQKKMNLNGKYSYPASAGTGTVGYVLDTGVYLENADFQGRAKFGFNPDPNPNGDREGHGTHVASTMAGARFGVARNATIVSVQVIGRGGTTSGIIAGLEWVMKDFLSHKKPSVINMSLKVPTSAAMNAAIVRAFNLGIVVVVSGGNDDTNGCDKSPRSADKVIAVGATTEGVENDLDKRASYSNFGPCVHIFAPGSSITAAWINGVNATHTISGTSMASPHVAGIALLYRGERPYASAEEIRARIIANAQPGLVDLNCRSWSGPTCANTTNLFAWSGCEV